SPTSTLGTSPPPPATRRHHPAGKPDRATARTRGGPASTPAPAAGWNTPAPAPPSDDRAVAVPQPDQFGRRHGSHSGDPGRRPYRRILAHVHFSGGRCF